MTKLGKSLLATVAMLSLAATSAEAQGKWSLGIGGGSTIALGTASDPIAQGGLDLSNGPHGILSVQYTLPSGLGFQIDGMGHWIYGPDFADTDPDRFDGVKVFNGTANILYKFQSAGKLSPYVLGGVGFYNYNLFGLDPAASSESETDFGWNAGAGFDYNVNAKLAIFFEGRFHQILSSDDAVPSTFNISVLPLSLGVRLGF